MNIQQLNQIQVQIDNFHKLEIESLLAATYPNQTELGNVQISRMTVSEFLTFSKRIVKQLETELKSENKVLLPFTFTTPEFGQANVDGMLSNLNSYIQAKQFPNAENSLLWLAHYQLQNGFFDKSKTKLHSSDILNTKKSQDDLDLIAANYNQLKSQYDSLLKEMTSQKKQLTDFYTQKQSELQQITNNLTTTNTNNTQIQNLLNASTQSQTKITSIIEQVEKDKTKIETTNDDINKTYAQFKIDFSSLLNNLKTTEKDYTDIYNDFSEKLKFVEEKQSYFVDRNIYLDNLIGREVGASLFETFKQRKTELQEQLKWWRIAVIAMTILTFGAILAIFTNFFGMFGGIQTALHWENILVNTIKASPFFFLLYYSISQYNKERNFQEEYAFKSAAALTIKAYSDILKDDKNKDELVLKAVYGIYRSPIYNNIKSTKEINSALDMVNEVISKGGELISKK